MKILRKNKQNFIDLELTEDGDIDVGDDSDTDENGKTSKDNEALFVDDEEDVFKPPPKRSRPDIVYETLNFLALTSKKIWTKNYLKLIRN